MAHAAQALSGTTGGIVCHGAYILRLLPANSELTVRTHCSQVATKRRRRGGGGGGGGAGGRTPGGAGVAGAANT
eukprot:3428256-Pyramimonas_sp.AAC.1